MAHKTLQELELGLRQAAEKVKLGGLYYHYKNLEQPYRVVDLVILEATDEIAVVYMSTENEAVKFVRPLSSWLEKVEHSGSVMPRFQNKI